jgi:hypothetical protein
MFFPGTPAYSTNKTDSHDITEILLKVTLNIINQTKPNLNVAYLAKTQQIPISLWFDQTNYVCLTSLNTMFYFYLRSEATYTDILFQIRLYRVHLAILVMI